MIPSQLLLLHLWSFGTSCADPCHFSKSEPLYRDYDGDGYVNFSDSLNSCEATTEYIQAPNDEFGNLLAGDCDDQDPDVNPGVVEICGDDWDQDCDGYDVVQYEDCQIAYTGCDSTLNFEEAVDSLEEGGTLYVCSSAAVGNSSIRKSINIYADGAMYDEDEGENNYFLYSNSDSDPVNLDFTGSSVEIIGADIYGVSLNFSSSVDFVKIQDALISTQSYNDIEFEKFDSPLLSLSSSEAQLDDIYFKYVDIGAFNNSVVKVDQTTVNANDLLIYGHTPNSPAEPILQVVGGANFTANNFEITSSFEADTEQAPLIYLQGSTSEPEYTTATLSLQNSDMVSSDYNSDVLCLWNYDERDVCYPEAEGLHESIICTVEHQGDVNCEID